MRIKFKKAKQSMVLEIRVVMGEWKEAARRLRGRAPPAAGVLSSGFGGPWVADGEKSSLL